MKKVISVFLALTMLFALSATALAQGITPTADKTVVKAGEDITVTLGVDETIEHVTVSEIRLHFNGELFSFKTGSGAFTGVTVNKTVKGTAPDNYMVANFADLTGDGTIPAGAYCTVTFTAKEDVTASEAVFSGEMRSILLVPGNDAPTFDNKSLTVQVKAASAYDGFAVSVAEDQTKTVGETAVVTVSVESAGEQDHFNALDMKMSYDPTLLRLESTELGEGIFAADNAGSLRIMAYGEDRALGTVFTLRFTTLSAGTAEVTVTSAKVDEGSHAQSADAPEATLTTDKAVISITGYTVSLGEDFTGESVIAPGEDYTFAAKDDHYDYTVTAAMGGETVTVKDNGDGTFTVENVTGNLVITDTKTPKTYAVTKTGTGAGDVTGAATAAYQSDYTFRVDQKSGFTYTVSVTVDGTVYSGYTVSGGAYTIPGADVTGAIVLNVAKTSIPTTTVTVTMEGTGAGDITGAATAPVGQPYTFTVAKAEGYTYEVTATVGGETVAVTDNGSGSYTIPGDKVNGAITIRVSKTAASALTVEVNEYVKLDGKVMYLVTAAGEPGAGKVYAYDGNAMFRSEKYNAYAWLIISDKTLDEVKTEAADRITAAAATAESVVYTGDVNATNVIDINDAQLVYDMYNAKYDSFEAVSVAKFLRADLNGSKDLTTEDAAAVVALIP